jgi:hypothetical protein
LTIGLISGRMTWLPFIFGCEGMQQACRCLPAEICRRGQAFRKKLRPTTAPAPDKLAVCWTGKHPPSSRNAGLRWTGKSKVQWPKRLASSLAPSRHAGRSGFEFVW